MRVLLAHPSVELYGSDRMAVESVRSLVGVADVVVVLPQDGVLAARLREAGARVEVVRAPVLRKAALRPPGLLLLLLLGLRTLPALVRAARAADLVLVNTLTLPTWPLAARLAGRPVCVHVHEAEEGLARPVAVGLHLPLLLCRTVLVNSRAAADLVAAALPRLRARTALVHNGVPGPPAPLPPPPAGPVAKLVLVGRLSPRKGTDVAVEALALLRAQGRDVALDLVGDVFPDYEWFADALDRLARDHGVADHVRSVGLVDDVWDLLAHADVVLVPSRAEPFGNVAVEAALAGRAVVASAVQGLREIVSDGVTGLLVPPDDPAALAAAVARLLDDPELAAALGARARADAQVRFSPAAYGVRLRSALGLERRQEQAQQQR